MFVICEVSTFFVCLVPGSAPRNIFVADQSSHNLSLTWLPPELSYGIITNYTIRTDFNNGTDPISYISTSINQFISNLQPYQTITVTISANNSKGEGPSSSSKEFRTNESRMLEDLVILCIVYYGALKLFHFSSVHCTIFITLIDFCSFSCI